MVHEKLRWLAALTVILGTAAGHPSSAGPFIPGIDVSNHQGSINWTSVKNAGIKFAFCKATEGVDFVDARFAQNIVNANSAGIPIGPYHFGRPDSQENNPNDAVDEAHDFVDAIAPYYAQPGIRLRPVLDVERLPTPGEFSGSTKAYLSEWIRDFIGVVVDRLGFEPLIYANTNYASNYFETNINQYDLWLANYNYTPPAEPPSLAYGIWSDWAFWQHSNTGSVSGIGGAVDLNVFEGTIDELYEFVAVPQTPTADFDADGDVDGKDFLAWQRGSGMASGATRSQGDANYNGAVTSADLAVWQSQYGGGLLGAVGVVPEPGAVLLTSCVTTCLSMVRRR
jgi:GH25 family lysozyme M1 (1,4-beta-N-acetylmuramidase)